MSGFIHDPLSHIHLITDNLRDRYKSGFPVLKEIVQNADDAGASILTMGWHPGFHNAEHPLLRDPALFFINNAELTERDAKGIRSLGLSSKTDNKNAVGKFGLGMKSLFHLCELYFYLGSDWKTYAGAMPKADVLNPWDSMRPDDWNHFTCSDKQLIDSVLSSLTEKWETDDYRFIVWLPLRSKTISEARGDNYGHIVAGEDYGREIPPFILDESLPHRLAKLMPLLKSVSTIEALSLKNGVVLEQLFSVSMNAETSRTRFPNLVGESQLKGKVSIYHRAEKMPPITFSGVELMVHSDALQAVKAHDAWPFNYTRDDNGYEQRTKDKAEAHAAVVITAQERREQRAQLTVQWSVFLPLGDQDTSQTKQTYITGIEGDLNFSVFLHGYFFIDAGRVGIHGRDSIGNHSPIQITSPEHATHEWNRILANKGTLPQLVNALSLASQELKLTKSHIESLTRGLNRFLHQEGSQFLAVATSEHHWVYRLDSESQGWARLSASEQVRSLPLPTSNDFDRVWGTLPGLQHLDVHLYGSEMPALVGQNHQWNEQQIAKVLASVPASVFASKTNLSYLNSFIDHLNMHQSSTVQLAIIKLVKFALSNCALTQLSANRSEVTKLVTRIFPGQRCTIGVNKEEQSLWGVVLSSNLEAVVVPEFLNDKELPCSKELSYRDAELVLANLNRSNLDQDQIERMTTLVFNVISKHTKEDLLRHNDQLRIFKTYQPDSRSSSLASLANLKKLIHDKRLFKRDGLDFKLGPELKSALEDRRVAFISNETHRELFGKNAPDCDMAAVLDLLASKPKLRAPQDRLPLVSKLTIDSRLSREKRMAARYLLHGYHDDNADHTPLFSIADGDSVWCQLYRAYIGSELQWSILPYELGKSLRLNPDEKRDLTVREMNAKAVLTEIGSDLPYIDFDELALEQVQAEEILMYLESPLWEQVPIHKTADGKWTAIDEHCLLHTDDAELPDCIAANVTWIVPATTTEVIRQQRKYLPRLDAHKKVELALAADAPHLWQNYVIETLIDVVPNEALREQLQCQPWLTVSEHPIAPQQVLATTEDAYLQLSRAVNRCSELCFINQLDVDVQLSQDNHTLISLFKQTTQEIYQCAIAEAAKESDYHIGQCQLSRDALVQASKYSDAFDSLPGWQLLIEYFDQDNGEFDLSIGQMLARPLENPSVLISVHEKLTKIAEPQDVADLRTVLLSAIAATPGVEHQLRDLTLRTQGNHYAPASELCYGVIGVHSRALLHKADWSALHTVLTVNTEPNLEEEATVDALPDEKTQQHSAQVLEQYFSPMAQFAPELAIAANLALMSGVSGVSTLCARYLGQRSLEHFVEKLGREWKIPASGADSRAFFPGKTLLQAIATMQFDLEILEGETAIVQSLFGDSISVSLESETRSIFLWERHRFVSTHRIKVQLRQLPLLEDEGEKQLAAILKNSAEQILESVYEQALKLDHIWESFPQPEQLDIAAARLSVLDGIVHQLKELRIEDGALNGLLNEYDRQYTLVAENGGRELVDKDKADVVRRISRYVESCDQVQQKILNAIRAEVAKAQYHDNSVPFELFQNADDAVIELAKFGVDTTVIEGRGQFRVTTHQDRLRFFNWGREVNQYRIATSAVDGTQYGFNSDLQKMLALHRSHKDEKTTGRFGLGFKSCLLVSDTPHVVSGRLAVEINGGLLPVVSKEASALLELSRSSTLNGQRATIVELPLRTGKDAARIVNDFQQKAPMLTVLAKQIHTIEVDGERYHWSPRASASIQNLSFGTIRQRTQKGHQDVRLAVYQTNDVTLVFARTTKGTLKPLSPKMPKLWHLAPLSDDVPLGFAINARFEVDIGRNQLALSSASNKQLFIGFGQTLGQLLEELYQNAQNDWQALRHDLELSEDIDCFAFWNSIWDVLKIAMNQAKGIDTDDVEYSNNYRVLLHAMLTSHSGPLAFYRERKALPTGLVKLGELTMAKASHRASKLLTEAARYLTGWDALKQYLHSGNLVSFKVGEVLLAMGLEPVTLDLDGLLEEALGDAPLSAIEATQLAAIFTPEFEELLDDTALPEDQRKAFRDRLSKLTLKTQSGGSRKLLECLLPCSKNEEEQLLLKFAPADRLASLDYGLETTVFLAKCRREAQPYDFATLLEWIQRREVEADSSKRQAVCRYIVHGDFGQQLADAVKRQYQPGWLFDVDVQVLNKWGWTKDQIDTFRNVRMIDAQERSRRVEMQLKHEYRSQLSVGEALERIYQWWSENADQALRDYEKELYPDGQFDWKAIKEDHPERHNEAWLKLFFLGSCQTIGRTKEVQHRSALKHFSDKGWWQVFTDCSVPSRWFDVMDEYLANAVSDENNGYRIWLNILPLYRFSRHLEDYIELFWSAEFGLPNINALVRPGSSSELSGSGFNLPELKATLGIGANFVLRELSRHGVYSGSDGELEAHCFVSSRGIQEFLTNHLGVGTLYLDDKTPAERSEAIYDFLVEHLGEERATFDGAYDIPLRLLMRDRHTLHSLLEVGQL